MEVYLEILARLLIILEAEFFSSIENASGKCLKLTRTTNPLFRRLVKEMCFGNKELARFVVCNTSILLSCTFECNSCLISKNSFQINQRSDKLPVQSNACQ